jgi:pyridoxal phosphate enzyme (YggS family)
MDTSLIAAIQERHEQVLDKIAETALRCGREPGAVRLVVVTKAQPLEVVRAAIGAGIRLLGENYADEAAEKIAALNESEVEWHMIGHVQSRKADLVARHFAMVHSLDSLKLAARLDRMCGELGRTLSVLLEFNVSGEESKFGFPAWNEGSWPDLIPDLDAILQLPHLRVRGLMTMPPYFEDPQETRPYFRRLTQLQQWLQSNIPGAELPELSMGTSADYAAAVAEGATYVRVGQAILGPRSPH